MSKAFRPGDWDGRYKIRFALREGPGRIGAYNWHNRSWCPNSIFRIGGRLHYLGSHAPLPIRRRWHKVELMYFNRYRKIL